MGLDGFDFIGLQEVGGFGDIAKKWDTRYADFDENWTFYCTNPALAFRGSAVGMPTRHTSLVEKVIPLDVGLCVVLKLQGYRQYLISAHLPHKQRDDCLTVWQGFLQQLEGALRSRRYFDVLTFAIDTNYELGAVESRTNTVSDERELYAGLLLRNFGLTHTSPETFTWCNTRGSESKIDYILLSSPSLGFTQQQVLVDSNFLLGSDHRAVTASFTRGAPCSPPRPKRRSNLCGKWLANSDRVFSEAQSLCHTLDLSERDLTCSDLASLAARTSFSPPSLRYKDPPEIVDKIRQRRRLSGREARELGKEIVRLRAIAKNLWLTKLLDRSANGDFKAISYFRRRQAVLSSHQNYLICAGGKHKAISDLKKHFRLKWTEPQLMPCSALDVLHSIPAPLPKPSLISEEEVCEVLGTCKAGKSAGEDGISYELLQLLMQTECRVHLVDLFNSVLFGTSPLPPSWLSSKLTLLPKVPQPSCPADLRPIVLSSTPGKLFTKVLLLRLRRSFPEPSANQLCSIPGSQTLDGSCALQHLTHLSQEFGLPLIAVKLDISSAFDTLSHTAVARFFQHCGPSLEAHVLLSIIVATKVKVSISDATWTQTLERGILQGSSYSAEIFARTLDFYLGALVDKWTRTEDTWIQGDAPQHSFRKIFTLLYADDLILLATSHAQATRMLQDVIATLGAIGLQLSLKKCKFIASPSLPRRSLYAQCTPLPCVSAFKFLGVLIGFNLSCQTVLSTRLAKATNAFWGYYKILRRTTAPVKKRLDLFNTFITSRWRWMSPAVRPLKGIASMLKTLHTNFLVSILALPPILL